MKSLELIKKLESHGWKLVRIKGSHHHFKHPDIDELISVPHPQKDVKPGTLRQILKIANIV